MFFEGHHSALSDFCIITHNAPTVDFPLHLHQALELYLVTEGSVLAEVDGEQYLLQKNQAVLVFPYQRHSYKIIDNAEHLDCIFSPDFASEFYRDKNQLCPTNNKFDFNAEMVPATDDYLLKKSFIYLMLSAFNKNTNYRSFTMNGKNDLLCTILIYISNNFTGKCTLKEISEHVGYDYAYISKFFKKETNLSLHGYVNLLRIGKAKSMLLSENLPMHIIAERCGFNCARSFNREFLKIEGISPSSFKSKNQQSN